MFHLMHRLAVLLAASALGGCGGGDAVEPPPASGASGGQAASALAPSGSSGAAAAAQEDGGEPDTGGASSAAGSGVETGGAGGDTGIAAAVFCDAPAKVLVPSCGGGSCHSNPGATIGDFAVDATRAYHFVDKISVRHADCGRIIDSGDYSKSFILLKVRGDFDSPYCGGIMPVPSFPPLGESQIDCLASWLQQFQL